MHHAGTDEPVLRRSVERVERVRSVAQPATLEFDRDLTGDREVERGDLVFDRRHVAGEVDVGVRAGDLDVSVARGSCSRIGHLHHSTR